MGTIAKIKLFAKDKKSNLDADIAAYKAGAGAQLLTDQRAMALGHFREADGDDKNVVALAFGTTDIPAVKTADLQHVLVEKGGSLAVIQAAVDAALAAAVHLTVTDGVTTAPGVVTSIAAPFVATDVGRKLRIIESGVAVEKTITVFNAAGSVNYNNTAGNFVAGTGKTVALLGAEVVQAMDLQASLERDGDMRVTMLLALQGQVA